MDASLDAPPVLQVHNVSAVFPNGNGGLNVLQDVSFSVQSQEFLCLLGPSGVGKSTLLRILSGLLSPTRGEILLHGEPTAGPPGSIGMVFQKANLMPWRTVLSNVMLPLEISGMPRSQALDKAMEMVELVGLAESEEVLPRDLSGGMAQRVAIARALVSNPEILLLDEPFGSLDALTRERMGAELLRIWQVQRKTVVMVTHSINEALFLADRVIVLNDRPGRVCLNLPVDLPRPREANVVYTAEFGALVHRVRRAVDEI